MQNHKISKGGHFPIGKMIENMKELLKIIGIFTLMTALIPLPAFVYGRKDADMPEAEAEQTAVSEQVTEALPQPESFIPHADEFIMLCEATGETVTMSMEEYIIGSVLAEMPASFEEEAIKAQAVAVHTYAVRRINAQQENPDPELKGAYISDNSAKYQAFFTPEQAEDFYGADYEASLEKITSAVKSVENEILVFCGEPIVAAFHSSSPGRTESAEIIWGNPVDYLVPAESFETEGAEETVSFTSEELSARLEQFNESITFGEEKKEWLSVEEKSPSGTVTKVKAGDILLSGTELRSILSLRSARFDVEYDEAEDKFVFTVRGSGHGVGMSQYGANEMAKQGSTYDEILYHYYKGTELISAP